MTRCEGGYSSGIHSDVPGKGVRDDGADGARRRSVRPAAVLVLRRGRGPGQAGSSGQPPRGRRLHALRSRDQQVGLGDRRPVAHRCRGPDPRPAPPGARDRGTARLASQPVHRGAAALDRQVHTLTWTPTFVAEPTGSEVGIPERGRCRWPREVARRRSPVSSSTHDGWRLPGWDRDPIGQFRPALYRLVAWISFRSPHRAASTLWPTTTA